MEREWIAVVTGALGERCERAPVIGAVLDNEAESAGRGDVGHIRAGGRRIERVPNRPLRREPARGRRLAGLCTRCRRVDVVIERDRGDRRCTGKVIVRRRQNRRDREIQGPGAPTVKAADLDVVGGPCLNVERR